MEIKEVFEPVLNFIKNLQKKDKEAASKQAAKDRLKLVLMQDRASVSPDFFEMMKKEIIDVIKKYIEIDEEALEVQLTRGLEAGLEGPALYANIPIKNVKPVAPKAEGEEEIDEKISDETQNLSEDEADKMAETILNHIENIATNGEEENTNEEIVKKENDNVSVENEDSEESKSEANDEISKETKMNEENRNDVVEEDKVVVEEKDIEDKKTTKKKASTTKKKTTSKTTTKKKTE